nr:polyphenol oxidase 1 [Gloriosa superba]
MDVMLIFLLLLFLNHLCASHARDSSPVSAMDLSQKHPVIPIVELSRRGHALDSNSGLMEMSKGNKKKSKFIPLSPNMSACHPSFTDEHVPVNCCPPWSDATTPIFDFEFPVNQPLRLRRPAHLATIEYISKYERAVAAMKQLPSDHPHNFYRQAQIHCLFCTGSYDQASSSSPPLILKIHRSWLFFPFHRMMIYFHERILGKLIGDDTFALPLWQWDSPDGMYIPDMYMNGSLLHMQRDRHHLPPRVADVSYDKSDERGNQSVIKKDRDQIFSNTACMYQQMVSGARRTELFMGCPLRSGKEGYCNAPGTIENAPHNTLHTWVGSDLNREREDMGAFYSAARDPIFYAHHANIDRLWEVWRKLNGEKSVIHDAEWLESHFYFYDENVRLVSVRVRDVLNITKFGYAYEDLDLPWLNARPEPSVSPKLAREKLKVKTRRNFLRLPSEREGGWTLDRTVEAMVHRPRRMRSRREKEEEEELLVVYGIDVKEDRYVKFDVYVNLVEEGVASPRSREFAGTFVNVPHGVRPVRGGSLMEEMDMKVELKLGVSEILEDLEADGDEWIWVTLVPRAGKEVNITVDGIRIEYM